MYNINLISFDIGNTLIQLRGDGFCSKFSKQTDTKFDDLRPLFYKYFLTKNYSIQYAVEKVCNIINYKYPQKIIDGFYQDDVELYWDVIPALKLLYNADMKMIAVSNCTPWEANGLEEFGLKSYIQNVFYSFDVGVAKPDPNIFLNVQNRLNIAPKNILHVGDSYIADVKGAIAIGWNAVYLDRNSKKTMCRDSNEILVVNNLITLVETLIGYEP